MHTTTDNLSAAAMASSSDGEVEEQPGGSAAEAEPLLCVREREREYKR